MPTALSRFILAALLLLPFAAHASDAEDFLAANPAQQAKLLQDWATQPDPARIELVDALQQGQLTLNGESKTVRLNNRLRGLLIGIGRHQRDTEHHIGLVEGVLSDQKQARGAGIGCGLQLCQIS